MSSAEITQCKVNHLVRPVGYDLGRALSFSWNVEHAKGKKQTQARVILKCGEKVLADTGFTRPDRMGIQLLAVLTPRTVYTWTVTVCTDAGEKIDSSVNSFETGKMQEAWSGQWITCRQEEKRHPVFGRTFAAEGKKLKAARLYICGLGLYEASVNGRKVGDEYLTPYCNDYHKWLQVQTYDITELMQKENTIAVSMGHGWYSGRFGFLSKPGSRGYYGDRYLLIAEIHLDYENGQHQVIATDDAWNVTRSHIVFSNIYDGEQVDDTLPAMPQEQAEKAAGRDLPAAPLTDRYSLPVREIRQLSPQKITTPAGEAVYDFGQEITGVFRINVHEPKGTVLRFRTGEVLQDGNFYNDNLRTARSEYIYVSDGQAHILQPKFTFYGFRYIKASRVTGDIHDSGHRLDYTDAQMKGDAKGRKKAALKEEALLLKADDITAIALSSDLQETGTLTTGNRLVNRLISNVEWGCRDNFVDVPTDCPQRDERMGWTADTQVFSATASYLHDTYEFYRKFLHDMDLEQEAHKGGVPFTVPSFGVDAGSSVWGDAVTIIPWNLYQFYGDLEILREQFGSMKAWVDYITNVDGSDFGWRRAFHFGDWLALDIPGMPKDATSGATDVAFIADVYYMYSAEIVRDSALLLERTEDADRYAELAAMLRRRILNEFYSPKGRCCADTQTGLLLTLQHHLAPKDRTVERLRAKFRESGYLLNCGFTGAPIMCRILTENGMHDIAAKLLLNEQYPGWLHEIKMGATTVWERWNSIDESGHISSTGMNSLNHYAYGSVLEWMYRDVAGISQIQPGFKKALIHPHLIAELGQVQAQYQSAAGTYRSAWKILDDSHVEITVTVPFDAEADLILPLSGKERDKCIHLCTGTFTQKYKTVKPLKEIKTEKKKK